MYLGGVENIRKKKLHGLYNVQLVAYSSKKYFATWNHESLLAFLSRSLHHVVDLFCPFPFASVAGGAELCFLRDLFSC